MAKRRRKKPNIPQAAIDHARQEVTPDDTPDTPADDNAPVAEKVVDKSKPEAPSKPRRRRRNLQAVQLDKRKSEGTLDGEYVADMLANPTKIVTEDDLRQDYTYVIQDLRNMGILAGVLFVALIGMALVIL